jgi:hypothetical protein
LGAHPRKQFIAQFAGIFVGTLVTVLSFAVLVPDASVLGSEQFPAPAAQTWSAVAKALSLGLSALAPVKAWSIAVGGALGVVLCCCRCAAPSAPRRLPSASASAWRGFPNLVYGPASSCWRAGSGGAERRAPHAAEEYTFPWLPE